MKREFGILLLVIHALIDNALCQISQKYTFKSYTIEDGLSQNSVYSLALTKDGFIWQGTNEGLNRFDGQNFLNVKVKTNDSSVHSNVVFSILAVEDGLLIGTLEDILFFDLKTYKFEEIQKKYANVKIKKKIGANKIYMDGQKRIWLLTFNNGIYCIDTKNKNELKKYLQDPALNSKATSITEHNNQIFISTEKNIYKFTDTFEIVNMQLDYKNINIREIISIDSQLWIAANNLNVLIYNFNSTKLKSFSQNVKDVTTILDTEKEIWLGTRSTGLFKINKLDNKLESIKMQHMHNKEFVLSALHDDKNQLWVGHSGGGLTLINSPNPKFELFRPESKNLERKSDAMILGMFQDKDSKYYFGTLSSGLLEYDKFTNQYKYHFDNKLPVEAKNIYGIINHNDNFWMATWAGLCSFNKQTKKTSFYPDSENNCNKLYTVFKPRRCDSIYCSGNQGAGIFNLHTKSWHEWKFNNSENNITVGIRKIQEVKDNKLYISSMHYNFMIYDLTTNTFRLFSHLQKYGASRDFFETESFLWIASDNGLLQVNKNSFELIKVWTQDDGLANNCIYGVSSISDHEIWCSSNKGLSKINYPLSSIINYTLADGLQDWEFNSSCTMINDKGQIVFGGINGVNFINNIKSRSQNILSKPLIVEINVNNKDFQSDINYTLLKELKLDYNQNFIDLKFISPNTSLNENISYLYQLSGVDEDWINKGPRNFVSYSQLNPGTYHFKIKAKNKYGYESVVNDNLVISIRSPYWMKWWFITLAIAGAGFIAYTIISQRVRLFKEREMGEMKIAKLEMSALHAQMNPHFIFNCLNSISEMILTRDNDNASKYLSKFASLIRLTLDHSKKSWISLESTVEYLYKYLEMEKIRFSDFEYQIILPSEISNYDTYFPPLIIQPLVENSIWHGLSQISTHKVLKIEFKEIDDYLQCIIDDNGIGYHASQFNKSQSHQSTGIQNIMDRIKLIEMKYNIKMDFQIVDKSGINPQTKGTIVTLSVPLKVSYSNIN